MGCNKSTLQVQDDIFAQSSGQSNIIKGKQCQDLQSLLLTLQQKHDQIQHNIQSQQNELDTIKTNIDRIKSQLSEISQGTIFHRIGGEQALTAAVDIFYQKLLSDPDLKEFFQGVNMDKQREKQRKFLTFAFGGPNDYTGKDLVKGHAHLKIFDKHFDLVASHLKSTLQQLNVQEQLINEVMTLVGSTRSMIVNQKGPQVSLYEQLGGSAAVNAAVDIFYTKVLADPLVKDFFKGVNMEKQREKQKKFMTFAFGGPNDYTGRDMKTAHVHLAIKDEHFNAIAGHLSSTLKQLNVKEDLIKQVIAIVETTRPQIVNTPSVSLYEELGGSAAVNAAVDIFYTKVLADPLVKDFFKGVNMEKQREKQKKFMTFAFGGPNDYTGRDMKTAHVHYAIKDEHFDAIGGHLQSTLQQLGVKEHLIKRVLDVVETTRPQIVNTPSASLYEQLGGSAAVNAAVDIFYTKVLADPIVKDFFKGVNMEKQREKQKKFMTFAFGGPNEYTGRDMKAAHVHFAIKDEHFNAIAGHLQSTLQQLGVKEHLIKKVLDVVETTRPQIVNTPTSSLYEQLGGQAAVNAAVDIFYTKVLADPIVKDFFKGVNMEKQREKQKKFMTFAFGGPNDYTGKDMKTAHVQFKIKDEHFNAIGGHLQSTLQQLGVKEHLIKQVLDVVETTRPQIVNTPTESLFEQLGGQAAVNAAVDIFYTKVLADPIVKDFFKGINMEKQREKQKKFLTMAFGGPKEYTGKDMKAAHAHLVLKDEHFNAITGHLASTLQQLGVKEHLIKQVIQIAESTRPQIVNSPTLYEKLGGQAAVNAAVDIFYTKVLADPIVKDFFKGVNMEKQKEKQKKFMTFAFGGPNDYTGKDMKTAHAHLKINSEHFNAIAGHLQSTLQQLNVQEDLIKQVMEVVGSTRPQIVNSASLFERLGGAAAVDAAVDIFYKKILSDDKVSQYFKGVNMEKQREKQKKFLTMAFGGPQEYTGKDLKSSHWHLHIKTEEFNIVGNHLKSTLEELKVAQDLVNEVMSIVASTKSQIVNE